MAKAAFHKNQRVYVKPVGTWALIERVIPQWVKGLDEPLKVHYDVGLGREFSASELVAEAGLQDDEDPIGEERWRISRIKNRWRDPNEATNHPFPGSFPVVLTDEKDWGGWRVPIAEYDRNPQKIEFQARLIEAGPALMRIAKTLVQQGADGADELPAELVGLAKEAKTVVRRIYETNALAAPRAAE
jgi:hypothetical protein